MSRRSAQTPRLTKKVIDALQCPYPPGDRRTLYVPDHEIPRLYVRVWTSNTKTFVVRAYVHGKKREFSLGDYGVLTLEDARIRARAVLFELESGRDPSVTVPMPSSLAARAEPVASGPPTFAEFFERFMDEHGQHLRTAREMRRIADRHLLPRFGTLRLDEIDLSRCQQMRTDLSGAPYEANRARDLLQAILNKALYWDVLPSTHANPVRKVERFREAPRDRVLKRAEADALLAAIEKIDSIHTRVLLRTLIDVPLRKGELMRATWAGFDASTATLRVSASSDIKGVSPQALPPATVREIAALPRIPDNPYIFPGRNGVGHIRDIDGQWQRVKELAGVKDCRLHDLRRTIATEYAHAGASAFQIQAALGQKTGIAARHYVHLASAEVARTLMEQRMRSKEAERLAESSATAPVAPSKPANRRTTKP